MKTKILIFSLVVLFTISCKNRNAVDHQIEKIIFDYSDKYKLKNPNVAEEYSSKQSYEIGFFTNNDIDTLFYIVKMEAYGLKEIGVVGGGSFSYKLNIRDKRIIEYPFYMGSFFYGKDSIPIHVYDVFEKYGKFNYNFDKLQALNFKDFIVTEGQEGYTPNLWLFKIKNKQFVKYTETDTMSYDNALRSVLTSE